MSQAFVSLLLPTAAGCVVLAPEATAVVLGSQWGDSAYMLGLRCLLRFLLARREPQPLHGHDRPAVRGRPAAALCARPLFMALIYPAFKLGGIPLLIGMKVALSSQRTCVRYRAGAVRRRVDDFGP